MSGLAASMLLLPIGFVVAMIWGPWLIGMLRVLKFGKQIRLEGPASHQKKQGTPTMGGILFVVTAVVVALVAVGDRAALGPVVVAMLLFGIVGAIDDLANMRSRVGLGLKVRYKFIWHTLLALVPTLWLYLQPGLRSAARVQHFPGVAPFDVGWLFIPLGVLAIFCTAAGVNEIDGLDGLAAGTCAFAFLAFLVVAAIAGQSAIAAFCAALIGALLGYLWFNVMPAQVFMGDTGSLALGAGLAVVALQLGWALLLPFVGFLLVVELVTVVMQVGYFKMTHGKRLFKMTPIHHHFELIGWPEAQIVQRFWLVAALSGAIGVIMALVARE